MKRLLALLVAAALIIGALLVRRSLDDEGGSNGNGGNGNGDGVLTLACVRELQAVCEAMDGVDDVTIVVEDASATAATLQGTDHNIDGWLTLAPWPEIAAARAGRTVTGDERVVGSTRLAIVVWKDRRASLEETACRGGITWRCLGDASGQTFADLGIPDVDGTVKVGHRPTGSAVGLLVLGNAVASFFGTTDVGTNDFNNDDQFPGWFRRLEREVGERDPYLTMLQRGRGAYAAVGTTEAYATRRAGASLGELDFLYPEPVATLPVVLVAVAGGDRDVLDLADARELRDGLIGEGFTPAADEPPELTGMPAAGALVALSEF